MSQTLGTIVANQGQRKMKREGKKMQQEAQAAIDAFEYQELTNPYDSLQVSTMGSDLMREENARNSATYVDAARGSGTRGLMGALPKIQAQTNYLNANQAAQLDQQQRNIDYAAAGQDVNNQLMEERRQAEELQGLGQKLNVGMGMKYKAYSDFYSTASNQSQHVMDLWSTFGGGGMGGGMMGGGGGGASMNAGGMSGGMPLSSSSYSGQYNSYVV